MLFQDLIAKIIANKYLIFAKTLAKNEKRAKKVWKYDFMLLTLRCNSDDGKPFREGSGHCPNKELWAFFMSLPLAKL